MFRYRAVRVVENSSWEFYRMSNDYQLAIRDNEITS